MAKHNSENNKYYNIKIDSGDAIFYENRTEPILINPSEYHLAVSRFRIPISSIPIFFYPTDPSKAFKIKLRYLAQESIVNLNYISSGDFIYQPNSEITSYQQFLDMVNSTLIQLHTNALGFGVPLPLADAPYMVYEDGVFKFIGLTGYNSPDITISFDANIHRLFSGLTYIKNSIWYDLVFKELKNNTTGGLTTMSSQYDSRGSWADLLNITLESDSIPLVAEDQGSATNQTVKVITDFEAILAVDDKTPLQYFPQGPMRYYDLKSQSPMSKVDVRVYFTTTNNLKFLLKINEFEVLTVKLLFERKFSD